MAGSIGREPPTAKGLYGAFLNAAFVIALIVATKRELVTG
jgi:hypothetical protein